MTKAPSDKITFTPLRLRNPTIWLDVSELVSWSGQVTGIQRVVTSVAAEFLMHSLQGERIRFCQLVPEHGFIVVHPETVERHLEALIGKEGLRREGGFSLAHRLQRISWQIRDLNRRLYRATYNAVAPRFGMSDRGLAVYLRRQAKKLQRALLRRALEPKFRNNDILLNVGAGWQYSDYAARLAAIREKTDLRYILLLHDVIPWKHPQFFPAQLTERFMNFIRTTIPSADKLLTTSANSRHDVHALAKAFKFPDRPISVIRLGSADYGDTEFELPEGVAGSRAGFVLCVGTVEIRKNHRLLMRTWSSLLERHDPSRIPDLVWAGRQGWMIEDLLAELQASDFLQGKLVWLGREDGVSDSTLGALYRSCLFTMFPSFYEGWGLPVSESLAHGKLCLASNIGSIPEAGGTFVEYFSPDDPAECLALTEKAIFDPAFRIAREIRIKQHFRGPNWSDCAQTLLATCRAI